MKGEQGGVSHYRSLHQGLKCRKSQDFGNLLPAEKVGKLPQSPFFKHDGPGVEIAAAGNVRMGDDSLAMRTR